jgi:hypothetical protein
MVTAPTAKGIAPGRRAKMKSTSEVATLYQPKVSLAAMPRLLAWGILLVLLAAVPVKAMSWYSGSAVAPDGTVNGWGVTDAYQAGMYHVAYASTTLTSPNGRNASSGLLHAVASVRVDVYLGWDANDLGNYLVSTFHAFYCYAAMKMIYLSGSSASVTAPFVVLTLRTGTGLTASPDNAARGEYNTRMGSINLGTYFSTGEPVHMFRTGVEIMGSVMPPTYTGTIQFRRTIVKKRMYHDTDELPEYRKDNEPDDWDDALQDQNPQSGVAGMVYDLDAPGVGTAQNDPVGYIVRLRINFSEWAQLPNGTHVSGNLLWFSHLSVKRTGSTTEALQTQSGITGDNIAGTGNPPTTWNLQAE